MTQPPPPLGLREVVELARKLILTSLLAMLLYSQKPWVSTHALALTLYVTGYALYAHAA